MNVTTFKSSCQNFSYSVFSGDASWTLKIRTRHYPKKIFSVITLRPFLKSWEEKILQKISGKIKIEDQLTYRVPLITHVNLMMQRV